MKFIKKNLVKRYGIPIRIYQNTSYKDGGLTLTGSFLRTDFRKQPYIDTIAAISPISPNSRANADAIVFDSNGKTISLSHEMYALESIPFGSVVAIKNSDDDRRWEYLQVVGKDDYYSMSDTSLYYLRSDSEEVNSDNEANDQLDENNRDNATNDSFFDQS